tara:strand:- start:386 stop:673 length:288 start_codon:yes stop_codon:yes gene_type:complete
MITLLYLLKQKNITYAQIIIISLIVLILGYSFPSIILFCVVDMYILLALTQFNILEPVSKIRSNNALKMDITTEGIEKDHHNVSSILSDYIAKFK